MSNPPNSTDTKHASQGYLSTPESHAYPNAIVDAQSALELYEKSKHGRFIWRAYQAVREADKHWPAHRDATIRLLRELNPDLEPVVSPALLEDIKERVLALLDGVVTDLLAIGETSGDAGQKAIKSALRIDGRRAPVNSTSFALREQIISQMQSAYMRLRSLQERYAKGLSSMPNPPPATATHVQNMVARSIGVSKSQVDQVWREYLREGELASQYRALIEECEDAGRELRRRPKAAHKAERRRPAKPASSHTWRRKINA